MAYKTGNPTLNASTFNNLPVVTPERAMTLKGASSKSMLLLALLAIAGYFGFTTGANVGSQLILIVLSITAFLLVLLTVYKKHLSPITAPIYAVMEGFILGYLSYIYEATYNGIVLETLLLTGGIFLGMLLVYRMGIIKPTENFKLGIAAATSGIAFYYVFHIIMSFFGRELPFVNSSSGWGIAFSALIVVIAALNFVSDFDFIEEGVRKQSPKYIEWFASLGLLITFVWLYLEVLRLLGKSRRR